MTVGVWIGMYKDQSMSRIASRLTELGIALPPPMPAPGGIKLPFPWINVRGDRVIISGHGPQNLDGSLAGPFGKVGTEVTLEHAQEVARKVGRSILGSLQRELGELDRIAGWARVFGMVNSAPGFDRHPAVINGFPISSSRSSVLRSAATPAPPSASPLCLSTSLSRSRAKSC
jgi:hypothetical protein